MDRLHKVSKVVSRLREEKSNLSFMAKYCISGYVRVAFNFAFFANRIFSRNLKHAKLISHTKSKRKSPYSRSKNMRNSLFWKFANIRTRKIFHFYRTIWIFHSILPTCRKSEIKNLMKCIPIFAYTEEMQMQLDCEGWVKVGMVG